MDIRKLLIPESVACNVTARSRKHTLDILGALLAKASGGKLSATEAFDAMVSRERLGCTALGNGVAFPHGRVGGIERPIGALVRLAEPVDFDTPDGTPVDLVFALLVPEDCESCQSEELAELSRLFADSRFRELLRAAGSAGALYDLLPGAPLLKASANG